jgi:hypothetical protein
MSTLTSAPPSAFRDTPLHQAALRVYQYRRGQIRTPMPGDAVHLIGDITGAGVGSLGIIDGIVGVANESYLCTFNLSGGTAFRGPAHAGALLRSGEIVSSGGGPALFIDAADFLPTFKSHIQRFWCWRTGAEADGGMDYSLEVPLWEWGPKVAR